MRQISGLEFYWRDEDWFLRALTAIVIGIAALLILVLIIAWPHEADATPKRGERWCVPPRLVVDAGPPLRLQNVGAWLYEQGYDVYPVDEGFLWEHRNGMAMVLAPNRHVPGWCVVRVAWGRLS